MASGKMKLTLETTKGELYELEGVAANLTVNHDPINVIAHGDSNAIYIPRLPEVELTFKGIGEITQRGIKEVRVVCGHCGSFWEESDPYHPGTCGNCGAYPYEKKVGQNV